MRVVIQRVTNASVSVGDSIIGSIGRGLCVLVGICRDDTGKDVDYIIRKILNLRLFDDDSGKRWSKNVTEKHLEILCISQFTLHAVLKGNKIDFHQSMAAEQSQQFYKTFLEKLKMVYQPDLIKDGQFGAYMNVSISNDGPVTITLDSRSKDSEDGGKESRLLKQMNLVCKQAAGKEDGEGGVYLEVNEKSKTEKQQ